MLDELGFELSFPEPLRNKKLEHLDSVDDEKVHRSDLGVSPFFSDPNQFLPVVDSDFHRQLTDLLPILMLFIDSGNQ